MQTKLKVRMAVIAAILLLAVYGIIGLPRSAADLRQNLSENIRLGLDLKGGSHLVLQVQVQDAVKSEAEQTIERLKDSLRRAGIDYAAIDRNDPATVEEADTIAVNVKGIPVDKTREFRALVAENFPQWILTPVGAADYRMNMSPSELLALKRDTVQRSIQSISTRIDELGLTEPVVQQYGSSSEDYQILVQLPGVDDPARVKDIMQTTAQLEITEVKDGPYPSREAALSQHGGILPLNTELVKMASRGSPQEEWYLLNRIPVVRGTDVRNARPGQDEFRKWETSFTLSQDGARRFGRFTEANIGNRLAVVLDD